MLQHDDSSEDSSEDEMPLKFVRQNHAGSISGADGSARSPAPRSPAPRKGTEVTTTAGAHEAEDAAARAADEAAANAPAEEATAVEGSMTTWSLPELGIAGRSA